MKEELLPLAPNGDVFTEYLPLNFLGYMCVGYILLFTIEDNIHPNYL